MSKIVKNENWIKDNSGKWYCYDNGQPIKGEWVEDEEGRWYYLDAKDGAMQTGWFQTRFNNNWFYAYMESIPSEGVYQGMIAQDCEIEINGKMYKFDKDGIWIKNINSVSDKLVEFSKNFEGYSSKFENIGDGEQTIGYGTATSGTVGKRIWNEGIRSCTKEQALEWFKEEMNNGCSVLVSWCKDNNINLSQNKFDACSDFIYNCGFGNFKKKIADIVLGNKPSDWSSWNVITTDAYGNFYQGLVTRRKGEMEIYNNGDYSRRP